MNDLFAVATQQMQNATAARAALNDADALRQQGDVSRSAERYDEFVGYQKNALALAERVNEISPAFTQLEPVAQTLINGLFMYADVLQALRQTDRADETRESAQALAKQYLGAAGIAEAERSRASSLIARGLFAEALVVLHGARDAFNVAGRPLKAARVAMDLADIFQWLGDYPRALELISEAAEMAESAQLRDGFAAAEDVAEKDRIRKETAFYRGIIAKYARRYDEAEEQLRVALPMYGNAPAVWFQLASTLVRRGKNEEGLSALQRIERAMRTDGMLRPKLAAFLRFQAEALAALGKPDEALAKTNEALRDGEQYIDPDVRWQVEAQHAAILRRLGRTAEALQAYDDAVATIASLRRSPLGYRLDNAYLTDKLPMFRDAIELAVSAGDPLRAAAWIEQIKARSLSAVLATRRKRGGSSPESEAVEALSRQLDMIEYDAYMNRWTREKRIEHARIEKERAVALERLRFSDPRWRNLSEPIDVDLAALQQRLAGRDQAAITLHIDGETITAVLLTGGGAVTGRKQLSEDVRANLADYFANLSGEPAETNDLSGALSITADDFVPAELWREAIACRSVIVVPHRELHLVPWASLVFEGKRLFEHCAVGVLPNLGCLAALDFEAPERPSVVLFGAPAYPAVRELAPLAEAANELKEIHAIYAGGGAPAGDPIDGPQATERALLDILGAAEGHDDILHICCHAAGGGDEPMNAALYLTDGKVDAAEVSRASLPFDEVILSACSTGWRPTRAADIELVADDCLGLPGAFLEAGARSVLVSIPKAADAASKDFMVSYHTARAAGSPPLQAFRQAQVKLLADQRWHPALWAGMTLYGCQ